MPIPAFNPDGLLPPGIHDCTIQQIESLFGSFQRTDRRPQLWARFKDFHAQAKTSGVVEALLLDGSFVTNSPVPNDIDVVIVVFAAHDFAADLPPHQYNVLATAGATTVWP